VSQARGERAGVNHDARAHQHADSQGTKEHVQYLFSLSQALLPKPFMGPMNAVSLCLCATPGLTHMHYRLKQYPAPFLCISPTHKTPTSQPPTPPPSNREYPGSEQVSSNLHVATKFAAYPWRITPGNIVAACKGSLRRTGLEQISLGQLHWSAAKYAPLQVQHKSSSAASHQEVPCSRHCSGMPVHGPQRTDHRGGNQCPQAVTG
jgi:hypothetical protein